MVFKARDKYFDLEKKPIIMGILNITPDSFSDGGRYLDSEAALTKCEKMINDGADIIDIGGESSRPGSVGVSSAEELDRIIPVIRNIRKRHNICISIDTHKPEVARAALDEGADIINNIYGTGDNGELLEIIKQYSAGLCLMHMRGTPETMQDSTYYEDIIGEVYSLLKTAYDKAVQVGLGKDSIVIDPGIGFGKSVEANLKLLKNIKEFKKIGCPVLIGTSRKSFIGKILGADTGKLLAGSLASNIAAFINGAKMFRVHDVKENSDALEIARRIVIQG